MVVGASHSSILPRTNLRSYPRSHLQALSSPTHSKLKTAINPLTPYHSLESVTTTMPNLQTIQSTISALPTGPPLVIAIVAGTSGIGSYIARAFARAYTHHGPKLRIYIIGRNVARAEEVISYGRATSPGSDWRFVQVRDLSILAEVERVCLEVIRLEEESEGKGKGRARLDCLYMGQALGPLVESPRTFPLPFLSFPSSHKVYLANLTFDSYIRRSRHPTLPAILLPHLLHHTLHPALTRC